MLRISRRNSIVSPLKTKSSICLKSFRRTRSSELIKLEQKENLILKNNENIKLEESRKIRNSELIKLKLLWSDYENKSYFDSGSKTIPSLHTWLQDKFQEWK